MDSSSVDNRITSFRKSKWKTFDPEFAQMIKDKYPSIWALGGNIRGNDQYRKLYPITQRGGTANSDMEINALELREAWVARHYEDFRIAGVIAQIKWLAVGSRGEQYMKNLVRERIDNMKHSEMLLSDIEPTNLDGVLAHFGVKGMRWGVRRASGGSTSSHAPSGRHGSTHHLSDAQLKDVVKRLEMEKKYAELTMPKKSKGGQIIKKVLGKAGDTALSAALEVGKGHAVKKMQGSLAKRATAKAATAALRTFPPPIP